MSVTDKDVIDFFITSKNKINTNYIRNIDKYPEYKNYLLTRYDDEKCLRNIIWRIYFKQEHRNVCPICGNVIHSMGEIAICCHGIQLIPEEAECPDDNHKINIERIEDEYYVHIEHEMTKSHCISFVAALSSDGLQMTKLYPEGQAENRFKIIGTRRIYYFCNRDGLFYVDI